MPRHLIDRFAINVTMSVGTTMRANYSGIFGFASVDISLTLQCEDNYYDANCSRYCEGNCTCGPGLTGPFCTVSIDDCVDVICGENKTCEDEHLVFRCVCEPGYTGPDCSIPISMCAGVNCNFGSCETEIDSFTCNCQPNYTGEFCERKLDGYQLKVILHSVRNPEGRCADVDCRGGCCDGNGNICPRNVCEYYFHYCLRPVNTPVSYECSEFQGNCSALNTLLELQNTSNIHFTNSMLTLFGSEWVSETWHRYIYIRS